jgi:putative transposase
VILTFQYRLVPTKAQHRALEGLLESQRQLYNAALEERIGAYRRGVTRAYFDQAKALTEWRNSDQEAASVPVNLQRATLRRLDEAYKGFFRRLAHGETPGFPRFRGKGWWDSFGFLEFQGIKFKSGGLRFRGMPGTLRVHIHRPLPEQAVIKSCTFCRDSKGWRIGLVSSSGGRSAKISPQRGSRPWPFNLRRAFGRRLHTKPSGGSSCTAASPHCAALIGPQTARFKQ